MRCTLIESAAEFRDCREAWNALAERLGVASVFLSWEWLSAWWEVYGEGYGEGRELSIIAVWDGESLVGAAPLYCSDSGRKERRLLSDLEVGADFIDIMVLPGREEAVCASVWEALAQQAWDRVVLDHVPAASTALGVLMEAAKTDGCRVHAHSRFPCPGMDLPESWDVFLDMPDKAFKHIVARRARRLAKKHDVDIVLNAPEDEIPRYLNTLIVLHTERWTALGKPGSFSGSNMEHFYRTVALLMAARGWLRLSAIRIDGVVEAIEFGMQVSDVYYSLQGGCSARGLGLNAGNALTRAVFESLVGIVRRFEYLRGAEAYKYQWGCEDRWTQRVCISRSFSCTLLSRGEIMAAGAKRAAKQILGRR